MVHGVFLIVMNGSTPQGSYLGSVLFVLFTDAFKSANEKLKFLLPIEEL